MTRAQPPATRGQRADQREQYEHGAAPREQMRSEVELPEERRADEELPHRMAGGVGIVVRIVEDADRVELRKSLRGGIHPGTQPADVRREQRPLPRELMVAKQE